MTNSPHDTPNNRASVVHTITSPPHIDIDMDGSQPELSPHSIEAEEATLGSLLTAPGFVPLVRSFLKPEDFFLERHGWIYEAILTLADRGDAVDERTVAEQLRVTPVSPYEKTRTRLDEVGGPSYLAYLFTSTPTALHAETYAHLVERAATRRRVLGFAGEAAQLAHDEERDVLQVINELDARLREVKQRIVQDGIRPVGEITGGVYDAVVHGQDHFVPTGFVDLDAQFSGGLGRGKLHVFAGRPGMGKSTLAVSMARNIAYRAKLPVVLISYEMSQEEIVEWLIAGQMKHPASDFWKLKRQPDHAGLIRQFAAATVWVADLPIFVNDGGGTTPAQIEACCREVMWRTGSELGAVFIDHINRAKTGIARLDYSAESYARVSLLAQEYKDLAKRLNVPIVVLAQLSRAVEQRQDKRPMLSDLRESGRIEEEADRVVLIYRESYYYPETATPMAVELLNLKNRQGDTGKVVVQMKREWTRFFNTLWTGADRRQDGGIDWKLEDRLDAGGAQTS